MAYIGYIPEKMVYVCASKTKEELYDDDMDESISTFDVVPTFPVEAGKKMDTAIKWTGLKKPKIVEFDNKPISRIKICNLEERDHGGRAYKVLIDGKYYVDMREDVVLDTILNCGIKSGGELNGTYVWAKYGSNTKLVRCCSALHAKFTMGTVAKNAPELTKNDIVIGGIYTTMRGHTMLYLGEYKTYEYCFDYEEGYSAYNPKLKDERLVLKKKHLFKMIYEFYYPKRNFKTCKPGQHFNNKKDVRFEFKNSMPKFTKTECVHDLTNIDIVAEVVNKTELDCKRWFNNLSIIKNHVLQNTEFLCLGKDSPNIHPLIAKYNLPVTKKIR